jgi:fatty-acyl-CoA synthase
LPVRYHDWSAHFGHRLRLIRFADALPRNATGKIHKPTLRRQWGCKATDIDQVVAS